jgi:hypothetical protein
MIIRSNKRNFGVSTMVPSIWYGAGFTHGYTLSPPYLPLYNILFSTPNLFVTTVHVDSFSLKLLESWLPLSANKDYFPAT